MSRPPAELVARQRKNNRDTAGGWDTFAAHRRRTTDLVLGALPPAAAGGALPSLGVLGAGNCNDLDLATLAARCGEVHLVDLDAEAVAGARTRVPLPDRDRVHAHAPVDLSGALRRLHDWRRTPPTAAQLGGLPATAADSVTRALPRTFDVTLSPCLLSQLMWACRDALGEHSRYLRAASLGLAVAHLRTLLRLTRPGGTAILVTDTLDSDTYPVVELYGRTDPIALLEDVTSKDLTFLGTGLPLLMQILLEDVEAAPLVADVAAEPPWLWAMTPQTTFLVYALKIRRAPATP